MQPLSFVLVFLSLALLVVFGTVLTGLGTGKLRHQISDGISTRAAVIAASWQSTLVAAGLLLISFGIFGIYRIIWGG